MPSSPHQVPRATRPDAETTDAIYLIKGVSTLRATYQIRLLALKAAASRKRLVLRVPHACTFDADLGGLIEAMPDVIIREDLQ